MPQSKYWSQFFTNHIFHKHKTHESGENVFWDLQDLENSGKHIKLADKNKQKNKAKTLPCILWGFLFWHWQALAFSNVKCWKCPLGMGRKGDDTHLGEQEVHTLNLF